MLNVLPSENQFAKAHHKIPSEISGCGPGLGELPEIKGFPFNISATAEAATSNLVHRLGLLRPIIKSHQKEKVGVALG